MIMITMVLKTRKNYTEQILTEEIESNTGDIVRQVKHKVFLM